MASLRAFIVPLLAGLVVQAACKSLGPPSTRSMPMSNSVAKRIIGGYTVRKGESPFLVSLQRVNVANRTTEHFCGASVIIGRFLLTAAHCVDRVKNNPEKIKAFLGTLRSGSLKTHDNHSHTEDSEDFRNNATVIIQKVLDGEKVMIKRGDGRNSAAKKIRRGDSGVNNNATLDSEFEYEACIEKIIVHDNFNKITLENDIAILVLAMDLPDQLRSHVIPVSLPTSAMEQEGYPAVGTDCTVYGWGLSHAMLTKEEKLHDAFVEPVAKRVNIEVRNETVCRRFSDFIVNYNTTHLGEYNNTNVFCAGNVGKNYGGAFRGDSGGPVICGYAGKYYQAGVVSYGSYTMGAYMPGFFTRVTAYEQWIKNVLANNL